jgi:cytochrome oxidase assembly protein ShyY1
MTTVFLVMLPVFPFLVRWVIIRHFKNEMVVAQTEEQNERDTHRNLTIALAGFSFQGVIALAIVNNWAGQDLNYAVYYLLISFLCYFSALNLQGYKFLAWHDQIGDAFLESGSLSLMLSIAGVVLSKGVTWFGLAISAIALMVWGADFAIRVNLNWKYLSRRSSQC